MRGLYPSGLQVEDFKPSTDKRFSNAEYLIYQEFESLAEHQELFAIYSFRLEHHVTKKQGEIDFIVISPDLGIIVLEVKGSKIKKDENGAYFCFNRGSSTWEPIQNPFKQAEENSFSLLNSLTEIFKMLRKRPLISWGCVFPENDMVITGLEVPNWRCINHETFLHSLYPALLEIATQENKKSKYHFDSLLEFDIKTIVELLVGKPFEGKLKDLDLSQGLRHLTEFTTSQYKLLEDLSDNDRVMFTGAAGTGKTFLAIQELKRVTGNGTKACLVVISDNLQAWVRSVLEVTHPLLVNDIILFDELIKGDTIYDLVLFDEIQDVLFNGQLANANKNIAGGLVKGKWRCFGDPFRQNISATKADLDQTLLACGIDPSQLVFYKLRLNVRNTKRINEALKKAVDLSGTELLPNDYTGENINFLLYQPGELAAKINAAISGLVTEGHPPHRISVILAKDTLASVANHLNFEYFPMTTAGSFVQLKGIMVGDEQEFKGLENDFVVYVLPSSKLVDVAQRIYVGMSRARLRLTLLCNAADAITYLKIIKS